MKKITNSAIVPQHLLAHEEWYAEIIPMTYGKYRIIVTNGIIVEHGW
jgi:hypothetical protein